MRNKKVFLSLLVALLLITANVGHVAEACNITLTPTNVTVEAYAISGTISVTANSGCSWSAATVDSWVTITSGASGTGSGTLNYNVAANTGTFRAANIKFIDADTGGNPVAIFNIIQNPPTTTPTPAPTPTPTPGCTVTISPVSMTYPSSGGGGNVNVTVASSCTWTASTADSWVTINSGSSGTGDGVVDYTVASNTGTVARTGIINISGASHEIKQEASGTPTPTPSGTPGPTPSGTPAPTPTMTPMPTPTPTCTVTINPMDKSFPPSGGTGSFSVTAPSGCAWTAKTTDTWVTITSGSSGTGNGTVNYTVASNTGTVARTAMINLPGASHKVKQEAPGTPTPTPTKTPAPTPTMTPMPTPTPGCTVTISPMDKQFPPSGGTGSFNVMSSCAWNAATADGWVKITSGNSGNGNGVVNYSVDSNPGTTARTGIINVGGAAFKIKQEAPGTSTCTVAISPMSMTYPSSGGGGNVNVTVASSCTWTASTADSWVTINSGSSGTGNGVVDYTVAAYAGTTPRTGIINISGVQFKVVQNATTSNCTVTLNPIDKQFMASGGNDHFDVITSSGCTWTASTADAWLKITSGSSGNANGVVNYSVAPNTGTSTRVGIINVAGSAFTVKQDAATSNCTVTLNPVNKQFPPSGGSGYFNVNAPGGCTWTAATVDTWVAITSGASGTGYGTVYYTVAQNTGTTVRTAMINVGGAAFKVVQDPPTSTCSIGINPTSKKFMSSGGTDHFDVTAGDSSCTWTATTADTWVTITSGASGSGNASVNYTVAQNTSTYPRTGIINVAGKAFTILQDPATSSCGITISPTNMNYPSTGGSGNVNVTASSSCAWTAMTADSWITINSGASGTGNGVVDYTVASYTGTSARTGIINIAGAAFTIVQNPSTSTCAITVSPTSKSFASSGGNDSVSVTADSACAWNASSSDDWIIITTNSSGAGSNTVEYSVTENTGTTSRTGTITIGGQSVTITQDAAAGCTFSIDPTSKQFQAYGGDDTLDLKTADECTWSAASNVSWILMETSGSGTTTIYYTVVENMGPARSGTMTIAGQTFTVTQLGTDCETGISINPISKDFTSVGGDDTIDIATPNTGCTWSAISNDTWISIVSGSSGTGNSTVDYTVAENTTSSARTGTMTIAGQTFTVKQEAAQADQMTLTVTMGYPTDNSSNTESKISNPMLGSAHGTVTVSSGKFSWSQDGNIGTASFKKDLVVVLSAQEGLGATIKGWTGCDLQIGTNQCMVKMTEHKKVTIEFSFPRSIQYDFDGDGTSDVIWRNSTNGDVYIWLMNGKNIKGGGYVVQNTGLDWDIKAVGDFNGDGRADLLWQNKATGDVYIYIMSGTTISTGGFAVKAMPGDWEVNALGDFDGEGKTDIMWRNKNTGDIYIWLMDGTNIIGGGYMLRGMTSDWIVKVVADLNGDKKSDLIWQNSGSGDVFVWLMNGLTVLGQGYAAKGIPHNWMLEAISDFNGDGNADILWHETSAHDYALWFMDGTIIIGGDYVTRGIPANWRMMKAGDYDGDGKSDIIWRDSDTGDVYLYILNDGTTRRDEGFVTKAVPAEWETR
ncbi:FG-GAP repeat-containing protein [Candidatus Magnetobacterium bavaricum]|uniref:FG-GAP repeat-containing protein n=1 Tax=Candidatus Magnetobacterium bavaricum TaxID=29290 RepID=A0A0F3GWP9_9BACT|nr:FG-GAP repeat-containing protein [Candidatus Magnetobacterium bavaricum]